jgi:Spy/CpxP family protein refolding chaperone
MIPMRAIIASSALLLLSLPAMAQTPGGIGSLPVLLGNETVRATLAITKSQAASLDAIRSQYRSAARKIAASEVHSPASRDKAQKDLDALTTSSNKQALAVLTSAQQKKLTRVEHKFLGATLLYSESIQRRVGLSPEQSAQIAAIRSEAETAVAKINRQFEEGVIGHHQRLADLREDRISRGEEILALLTPVQRDAFAALGL